MLRWVVIGVVIFILYKLVANEMRKRGGDPVPAEKNARTNSGGGDMAKDPTCGAYVDAASSISVRDGDSVHRFCSYECRDAFLEKLRETGREIPERKKDEDV